MTTPLEHAIARFFDATNRGDSDAFLDAFAPDGVLEDWGRVFTGREAIARWNERENIGVRSHIEPGAVTREGDAYRVAVEVTGGGYSGGGAMTFTLRDGKIARMVITG